MFKISSTRVKFIIFPLVHEETQIQNLKCCNKCEMKVPVSAACVWMRPTWSTSDHVGRKTWTFEDCSFSKLGFCICYCMSNLHIISKKNWSYTWEGTLWTLDNCFVITIFSVLKNDNKYICFQSNSSILLFILLAVSWITQYCYVWLQMYIFIIVFQFY